MSSDEHFDRFNVKNRALDKQRNIMNMLGDLLVPVTEGFPEVNLDMSFSYLGNFDLFLVQNIANSIHVCTMWDLKQSEYLLRGELAVLLNSRRSRNAKSMNLFTEVTTHSTQSYKEENEEKKGFNFFGFKKQGGK